MIKVKEVVCQSILSKSKLPGCDYVINPYIGCSHGCVWCYARFMKDYSGHKDEDWGGFVDVKVNAPEVLLKEVRKLRPQQTVFLSSVCDPYQPIEGKYKITRKCLEILSRFPFPVSILTQSKLVVRDVDLFRTFKNIEVGMSFITMNERATRIFQPLAASPKERIEVLKHLHQKGIRTYVHLGPILPYFTNFEEIFKEVYRYIDWAMGETLNTKGENWIGLRRVLLKYYPNLLPEFEKERFKDKEYLAGVKSDFEKAAKKYDILPAFGGVFSKGG